MLKFFIPFPVTKYEIIKSSNDIVKAINAPETIPGMICGTITLIKAIQGVHPKSIAASAKFGSRERILGITDKITYGIQNAICANNNVVNPFSILNVIKNNIKPIAVTISGFIKGKSLICIIKSCTIFFDLERPIALIVPTTVETTVAMIATIIVTYKDSIIDASANIFEYHCIEKPVK